MVCGILSIFIPSQSKGILKIKYASRDFSFFPLHQATDNHITDYPSPGSQLHGAHISKTTSALARDAGMGTTGNQVITTMLPNEPPKEHKNLGKPP